MAIIRPVLTLPGQKRSRELLQFPNTGRSTQADGTTAWYFQAKVKAKTPHFTWTLSPFVPAIIWDTSAGGPTGATGLDLANNAYLVFCLDNTDQLYAVRQDQWAFVTDASDLCPIAWVDSHHDLVPRLSAPVRLLFACLSGSVGGPDAYGDNVVGTLAYPSVGSTAPGPVGSVYPSVSANRLASLNGALMAVLKTGQLAYLPTPDDPTSAVLVDLPRFTATDVTPRCLGINSNPTTGTWWALVEYDPGATTHHGVVVLSSTVQAATASTNWALAYTIIDMGSAPSATPGMAPADAATYGQAPPYTPVSGEVLYVPGTGYSLFYQKFFVAYDGTGVLWAISIIAGITVYYPDNTTGSVGPQFVPFPGTPSPGTYSLWSHRTLGVGLTLSGGVPSGAAVLMSVTVTPRADAIYHPKWGNTLYRFVDNVTVSEPQTFPHPTLETFGRFMDSDITAYGTFINIPTPYYEAIYTSGNVGVRTDNISITAGRNVANPLCYCYFQFGVYGDERSDCTSNFFLHIIANGVFWSNPDEGTVERATVLPHTCGYATGFEVDYTSGPTIEAVAFIGSTIPTPQYFGIGPNGETLVNPGSGTWYLWHYVGTTVFQTATHLAEPPSVQYLAALFGGGTSTAVVVDGVLLDASGLLDANPVVLAYYDGGSSTYYAVWPDASLRTRAGPAGTAWVKVVDGMVGHGSLLPCALRLRSDGITECIYDQGSTVFLARYDPTTNTVTTSAGEPFPGGNFGVAAFLT